LESLLAHQDSKLRVDAERKIATRHREEFVQRKMKEYDAQASMLQERKQWGWSPLFHAFRKAEDDLPPHIRRPFEYSDEELGELLCWVVQDILPRLENAPVPLPVLSLKLLSRFREGPCIPLSCPIQGPLLQDVKEGIQSLRMSSQDVLNLGSFYFPGLQYSRTDLAVFRDTLGTTCPFPEDADLPVLQSLTWLQMMYFKACHDMVVSGKRDHLFILWTSGPGVSRNEARRQL
jgi:hypothetical protein